MSYSMLYQSPVGNLEIITDGEVVTQLEYLYQYTHLRFPTNHELYIFKKVKRWLDDYFLGNNPELIFLYNLMVHLFNKKYGLILIRFHMESLLLTERLPNISVNY